MENHGGNAGNQDGNVGNPSGNVEDQDDNARNQDGNAGIQILDRYFTSLFLVKISLVIFLKSRKG